MYTRFSIIIIGFFSLLLALLYNDIVNITIIFKSIGIIIAPIVVIIWFTKGDNIAIISSVVISTILIIGLAFIGFIKPELIYIAMLISFIAYTLTFLIKKIVKKPISH